MNRRQLLHRRQFLGTAASVAAVGSLYTPRPLYASAIRETDHFWCRLAPEGPYIDTQRDNKAFGFGDGKVFLSEGCGQTWAYSAPFPEAEQITFSCLLKNGNILWATCEKLFLSTDNLKSHREVIVKDQQGRDYRPHTPVKADEPGWYFHPLDGIRTWDIDGSEILVWGNCCNVLGGPAPVNIYYSTDQGETVKIAYSFGQNPKFQQKGAEPANFLGDASNPVICRHVHSLAYHPSERAFYACTGDLDRGFGKECHWLRGTYDLQHDAWDWQVILTVNSNSRYKSGGINFADGQLYWTSDANGPKRSEEAYDRGIFRCAPADLADTTKHTLLFDLEFEVASMIIQDDVILAGHAAKVSTFATGIIISPDMGQTWKQYDLAEYGPRSLSHFSPKNSDGWFRADLRTGWNERGEVLFLKPKV